MKYDLSVLIPARSEEWLAHTVADISKNIRGNTEIIVVLDGAIANPPLKADPRVTIIYHPQAVGQRAASNDAARLAKGKYLMKIDAHCAVDEGFDVKMIQAFKETGDNVTMIPGMKNFHIFDWVCPNGHRRYQGRSNRKEDPQDLTSYCKDCGLPEKKEVVWYPKPSPWSTCFRFDRTMHFQYWRDYSRTPQGKKEFEEGLDMGDHKLPELNETMSIQGSCFMITKEKWFELDICSEEFHSWGQQGVEVACKTWLSGGRVIVNRRTWYAHMFRTQGGDFGFPYSNPQSKVEENRELSRQLFKGDRWPKAVRKFQWLLDHFNPPDWSLTKGIIYYTDNQLDERIAKPVRDKLHQISQEDHFPLVCASLKKMDFGTKNVRFPSMKRGYVAMFKQILGALENSTSDVIFFCEHDVLYHPSHFDFLPADKETFYYNQNVWYLRPDGFTLHYDVNQLSGLCVYREVAIIHFKERLQMVEEAFKDLEEGEFNKYVRHMGFEPMTHNRIDWKNKFKFETWKSEFPNIDIRHGDNATGMRWKKEQYRNQQLLINWQESTIDKITGWTGQDFSFVGLSP